MDTDPPIQPGSTRSPPAAGSRDSCRPALCPAHRARPFLWDPVDQEQSRNTARKTTILFAQALPFRLGVRFSIRNVWRTHFACRVDNPVDAFVHWRLPSHEREHSPQRRAPRLLSSNQIMSKMLAEV